MSLARSLAVKLCILGLLMAVFFGSASWAQSRGVQSKRAKATPTVSGASAAADQGVQSRLDEIEQQVKKSGAELESIQRERREVSLALGKLKGNLVALQQQSRSLAAELEEIASKEQGSLKELERIQFELDRFSQFAAIRVRSLLKQNAFMGAERPVYLAVLPWVATDGFDVAPTSYLLERVGRKEQQALLALQQQRRLAEEAGRELDTIRAGKLETQDKLAGQELKVLESQKTLAATEQSLKEKEQKLKTAVVALRAQALRLETVVRSITEAQASKAAVERPKVPTPTALSGGVASAGVIRAPQEDTAFVGRGLASSRGSLPLPVFGRVIRGFGKQRFEEFSDLIFHRGIEFGQLTDQTVRAVAEGRVMYSGTMPGYGLVVILDHGQRYYTVNGRLGTSLVTVGQILRAGQELGLASSGDLSGRMFYFEIRLGGTPQDPAKYLKSEALRAAAG